MTTNNYIVSADGGDMGRAESNTLTWQIPIVIETVANIFHGLRSLKEPDRLFNYCIQFDSQYKETVKAMLSDMKKKGLPRGVDFYETDGRNIFELRGASGGITTAHCFYIIAR